MNNMDTLASITCTHLRAHESLHRSLRAHLSCIPSIAIAFFTVMAWWGTSHPHAWLPIVLLAALTAWAALKVYSYAQLLSVQRDLMQLSAFHDMVLEEDELSDSGEPHAYA